MSQTDFIQTLFQRSYNSSPDLPDKHVAQDFIDKLFTFLFTPFKSKYNTKERLLEEYINLRNTFAAITFDILHDEAQVKDIAEAFFNVIPGVYNLLLKDAAAILEFDPAAASIEEVLLAYPGFYATAIYRLAHELQQLKLKTLARILSEHAHAKTGIDIHPGAVIGESFFIDHGTGIVVGETTVIGNNVKIYQGVTLGALNVSKKNTAQKRHPTIEDNVIIYSGATVLGNNTRIGHDSIIGGNVWLTESVAPYSVVYHKSEIIVRDKFPLPEAINFVI